MVCTEYAELACVWSVGVYGAVGYVWSVCMVCMEGGCGVYSVGMVWRVWRVRVVSMERRYACMKHGCVVEHEYGVPEAWVQERGHGTHALLILRAPYPLPTPTLHTIHTPIFCMEHGYGVYRAWLRCMERGYCAWLLGRVCMEGGYVYGAWLCVRSMLCMAPGYGVYGRGYGYVPGAWILCMERIWCMGRG